MKKRILLWLGIIVALIAVSGFFLPTDFAVERNIVIDAPPAVVSAYLSTPRRWNDWSAWSSKRDPTLKYTYSGPESGKGAKQQWTSEALGSGWLKIVGSHPKTGIVYLVGFDKGSESYRGTMLLQRPADGARGVHLAWTMLGSTDENYLMRYMALKFDDWIGADFELGLKTLKILAEAEAIEVAEKEKLAKTEAAKTLTATTSSVSANLAGALTATPTSTTAH